MLVADPTSQTPSVVDEAALDSSIGDPGEGTDSPLDLDHVERTLDGVATALHRLDEGTYWTDEATGEPLAESVLEADPVARRRP